jgi:hypothetical protein
MEVAGYHRLQVTGKTCPATPEKLSLTAITVAVIVLTLTVIAISSTVVSISLTAGAIPFR